MVCTEEIRRINLFEGLPDTTLEKMAAHLHVREYGPDEQIFYHGDPGTCMYMIINGQVSVSLSNEEGTEYTIATLSDGDIFGEMALLTGGPRSANVRAKTAVKLMVVDQEQFAHLTAIQEEVNTRLLCLLSNRLGKTTHAHHIQKTKSTEVIASLLHFSKPLLFPYYPGESTWAKNIQKRIIQIGAEDTHVLIKGPPGTEKTLVAQLIHQESTRADRPLLTIDCANPPPVYRTNDIDPSDTIHPIAISASQQSALFGHKKGSSLFAKNTRRGYLEIADNGTLLLENIHHLSTEAQTKLLDFLKGGTHCSKCNKCNDAVTHGNVRIIATAGDGLDRHLADGIFNTELIERFSSGQIQLKPLSQRKKDIPVFAKRFRKLYERKGKPKVRAFSDYAINALVDYEWPLNVDELEQVISRATALCAGDTIEEDHIFLDITPFSMSGKINLLKNHKLHDVMEHRHFPRIIHLITTPILLFLLYYCFFGPAENNLANMIIWCLWWPSLLLITLIASRFWCSICPLQKVGELLFPSRKKLFLPKIIKTHGVYVSIVGIATILWAEHYYRMVDFPTATGLLLLTLLIGLMLTDFFFGKRVWCRFFCPLGQMISRFASLSLIELRSNVNVCSTQCFGQDCIKDSNCPMGIHPSAPISDHDCILCLSCVKTCTHKAVHLDARLPFSEVLQQKTLKIEHSAFAILLTGSLLSVELPSLHDQFSFILYLSAFLAICMLVSISVSREKSHEAVLIFGYSCLPLAFMGLFCLFFRQLLHNGHLILPLLSDLTGLSNWIPHRWITPNLGTLYIVPPLLILMGSYISWQILIKLAEKHINEVPSLFGYKTILLTTTALLLATNLGPGG